MQNNNIAIAMPKNTNIKKQGVIYTYVLAHIAAAKSNCIYAI